MLSYLKTVKKIFEISPHGEMIQLEEVKVTNKEVKEYFESKNKNNDLRISNG